MPNLKIQIYKADETSPETIVTIPLRVLRIAREFLPKTAEAALKEQGIDLDEISVLVEEGEFTGKLFEVEKREDRIVITIE